MKEIIKKYLEDLCRTDAAIADKYEESKLDACLAYINSEAKKYLKSVSGFIEDAIVYKWARDFILGDITEAFTAPENKAAKEVKTEEIQTETEEIEIKPAVVKKNQKKDKKKVEVYDGPDLFDFDDLY